MTDEPLFPILPYTQEGRASAGYAEGSGASEASEKDRALTANQLAVYELVKANRRYGLTGYEASGIVGRLGGSTGSAILSIFHDKGRVARLVETRMGFSVYVLPECVDDRETEPRGMHGYKRCPNCGYDLRGDGG